MELIYTYIWPSCASAFGYEFINGTWGKFISTAAKVSCLPCLLKFSWKLKYSRDPYCRKLTAETSRIFCDTHRRQNGSLYVQVYRNIFLYYCPLEHCSTLFSSSFGLCVWRKVGKKSFWGFEREPSDIISHPVVFSKSRIVTYSKVRFPSRMKSVVADKQNYHRWSWVSQSGDCEEYNFMECHRRFGEIYCLCLHGQRVRKVSNYQNVFSIVFDPEDGGSTFLRIVTYFWRTIRRLLCCYWFSVWGHCLLCCKWST
jgi:hypothetical protein